MPTPADPTLDLDLAAVTDESRKLAASIKPGSGPWDVIVVGSGAAGGMAAFQLATAGIDLDQIHAQRSEAAFFKSMCGSSEFIVEEVRQPDHPVSALF